MCPWSPSRGKTYLVGVLLWVPCGSIPRRDLLRDATVMPRSGAIVQSLISGVWRTNRNTTGQHPPRLGRLRDVSAPRVRSSQERSSLAHAQANVLLEPSLRTTKGAVRHILNRLKSPAITQVTSANYEN